MKQTTLSDITQEDFDSAVEVVISGIKAYNRKLDTRTGTVLRDLLVNPEAAIEGVTSAQIDETRKCSSLARLKAAQDAGEDIDPEDVNAILSNFNITPSGGRPAVGTVKVVVSDGTGVYSVAQGSVFSTADGRQFVVDSQVIAALASRTSSGVVPTTELYEGAAGYFFLVPVTASAFGSDGNITRGTALTPETRISSFVMAEAYKDFDGGTDTQTLDEIIRSIPSGLSIRGFVNKPAVEGMLRSEFDSGDYPIVAVSTVGYGNVAQIRDRHNAFGVGVGGRIDVYIRNFTDMATKTETLTGVKDEDGKYTITVPKGTFPGSCWIKSVSDPFTSSANDEDSIGTLAFSAKRAPDISGTWHDIVVSDGNPSEAFNTVWQGFEIKLEDVPADAGEDGEDPSWSDARDFKVTAYILPQSEDIQAYVDRDDVRSVATDVVVRCPIICNVSVSAVVRYDPNNPIDDASARTKIRNYINGLGFVGRLTRSEIVQILKNMGAVSVDMPNKDMLYGVLHDANGTEHSLMGDALDISSIEDGSAMLTKDTVVFAAEDRNIQVKLVPNA